MNKKVENKSNKYKSCVLIDLRPRVASTRLNLLEVAALVRTGFAGTADKLQVYT